MQAKLQAIRTEALAALATAGGPDEVERLRVEYLGRKGLVAEAMAAMRSLPPGEKPAAGRAANEVKRALVEAFDQAKAGAVVAPAKTGPAHDISLPGRRPERGRRHPITQTIESIKDIFIRLGFEVALGPEVETNYYNFEALNIPLDHPSRDAFDTFYLHDDVLLRSQTSTVQVRVMENRPPPVRVIAPGKVFRPDTVDASHMFLFHQVEGLMVDEDVTLADLKYVLHEFARTFYGEDVKMRFRPHFFPFTEPSVEVDIGCFLCGAKGCSVCSQKGWLEVLGAGMVDPNVFEAVGYDPERYTGFAFGMGIDRVAMLKYGITDIRLLLENDLRFLEQF